MENFPLGSNNSAKRRSTVVQNSTAQLEVQVRPFGHHLCTLLCDRLMGTCVIEPVIQKQQPTDTMAQMWIQYGGGSLQTPHRALQHFGRSGDSVRNRIE